MDFFEVLRKRQSIRSFRNQSVKDELLDEIISAANRAPSAGNLQSHKIYIVKNNKTKVELSKAALDQHFIAQAPVVFVFCTQPKKSEWKYGMRGRELYSIQDAAIACTFAMLAATALGLGSVWVGAFNERAVHKILGSPAGTKPVALLPIGYAAEKPPKTPRGKIEDMVEYV